jgi:DNA-binding NtrC family response regulator
VGERNGRTDEREAPAATVDPWACIDLSGTMGDAVRRVTAAVERRKVEQAMREAGGNRERAAETLQISYKALLQKLRDHGIET